MTYKWGSRSFSVPAQVVGNRIERLSDHDGNIRPDDLVNDARPVDSPLHPLFTWDDTIAGALYRKEEGMEVIRSLVVIQHVKGQDGPPRRIQRYVAIGTKDTGTVYTTTARALTNVELRKRVIDDAINQFLGLRRRYDHLEELAEIFKIIDEVDRKLPA